MKRQTGVLLPVFSLPGEFGCGGFGKEAYRWIDALKEGGFSLWQVLPFGVPDEHDSPYMSYSSFGGNPFFIDPGILFEKGLVTREEMESQRVSDPYLCRFEILRKTRFDFLKKAASRFSDRAAMEAFLSENPDVAGTCRYLSLKEKNGGKAFSEWTEYEPDETDLFARQFIQFEFHRQWEALHAYAKKAGIRVLGDLPFYVAKDSYDLWSDPGAFQLDPKKQPSAVAGVPPDYFSQDGQLWGNPLYDWEKMEKDGFSWWKKRLGYQLKLFDGVRIDHFRAICAYWSIPAGAKSAKEGKWVKGPGEKLTAAFREIAGEKFILAEDLGIIDDDTRLLLKKSGFPGMAVYQFGFDGNPLSPHLPQNYERNLAAYSGTHDNNTLLGFLLELDGNTRKTVLESLGDPSDFVAAVRCSLLQSRADLVIFPVQDLLGFGSDTRVNRPGTAEGNWKYRVTSDQIASLDLKKFYRLNRFYNRI